MAIRIDDSFAPSSDLRSTQVRQTEQLQNDQLARSRETEARGDSVSLSALGQELARSLNTQSPQEIARVEQAQQAVNNGTLSAPADEIAQQIITEALETTSFQARSGGGPPSPLAK
jgi:anti-sigma28 factor (negative regulator of flagellin synthesis)